ncbi:hypothetical protein RN001_011701, partial [Aquatica leii]
VKARSMQKRECHQSELLNSSFAVLRLISSRKHVYISIQLDDFSINILLMLISIVCGYKIVLSLAFAVASATYPYSYAHLYGQHIPLIDHNGVPVDTPEVQAAKAAHFSAHAAAHHGFAHVAAPVIYAGPHHYPIIDAAGRPLDTPEVQHAKAAHFHAYNEAAARNHAYGAPYAVAHVGIADTPEVQVAKAAHLAAHAHARAQHGHYRKRRGIAYHYPYAQHIPVIDHNGVPVETPEVQAAKAEHFAAHAKLAGGHAIVSGAYHGAVAPVVPYASAHLSHYPIHIPVITAQGVPADTIEVQHEKAKHFAAHAKAHARNAVFGHHY